MTSLQPSAAEKTGLRPMISGILYTRQTSMFVRACVGITDACADTSYDIQLSLYLMISFQLTEYASIVYDSQDNAAKNRETVSGRVTLHQAPACHFRPLHNLPVHIIYEILRSSTTSLRTNCQVCMHKTERGSKQINWCENPYLPMLLLDYDSSGILSKI